MTWDTATGRARLGYPDTDTSHDADIDACMAVSLSLAERYCDRRFQFKAGDVAKLLNVRTSAIRVYRWPIKQVVSITVPDANGNPQALTPYAVDEDTGTIYLRAGNAVGMAVSRDVTVTFDGGFDPLPDDLEFALWAIFDAVWASTPGWGLPAGSGPDTGAVRSFSIDGMSIGYDTSGTQSGGNAGGAADAWGVIPARAIAVLNLYRAETAVGGA